MIFSDPNVIYVLLLAGLWAAVFSIYTPGTGLGELAALGLVGGAFVALIGNPATNWIGVALVCVGTTLYLLLPLYRRSMAGIALAGLAIQAVGALAMLDGAPVSPLIIGATTAITFALYQWALIPFLNRQSSEPALGDEELLPGASGWVVSALNPTGTVNVRSEQWSAYSEKPLQPGEKIVVIRKEGLRLYVERAKAKRVPEKVEIGADGELKHVE